MFLAYPHPGFNSWQTSFSQKPRYGGTFRIKLFADSFREELDPTSPDSFIFISEQIYDGLVRLDKNFNPIPSLAEYWKISSHGEVYTFYLKKGIKFHHGKECTAEDVKFSLERLLDKQANSPYYQFFLGKVMGSEEYWKGEAEEVFGFRILDRYSFEIHWTKPYVSALYLMSMHFCKILPRDLVLNKGRRFFRNPSGTGPFKFKFWLRDTKKRVVGVRLGMNEDYFLGRPYLDTVEFCPYYNLKHFLDQEIDFIPVLSESWEESNFQVFKDSLLHAAILGMSCQTPPFNNPVVRKAISYAVDKEDIVRAASDERFLTRVIDSYIPPKLPGFLPRNKRPSYNFQKAKKLLQKAGVSSEREFPKLTLLLALPRTRVKGNIYKELKRQLEPLGIKLKSKYYDSFKEIKRLKGPYLILIERVMNFPDPEDMVRPLFYSSSIFNVFNYDNHKLDRFLEIAEVERSWTTRTKLFQKIEQILFKDVPAFPLYSNQSRIAIQPYVKGLAVPPLGFNYLEARKIWLDK